MSKIAVRCILNIHKAASASSTVLLLKGNVTRRSSVNLPFLYCSLLSLAMNAKHEADFQVHIASLIKIRVDERRQL